MNILDSTVNTDIMDSLIQMSDYISELDTLIENVNVLTEEIYTSLVNQIDLRTEKGRFMAQHNLEVSGIKAGMVREFVIRANAKISELIKLSDKSMKLISSENDI